MEKSWVKKFEEQEQWFRELFLCHCGYSICESGHHFGPAVRPNYILHYVLEGKGTYHIGNRTYELEKEEGFLIEPNVMTFYQADEQQPWQYLWIGFQGSRADKLMREMGLSYRVPTFSSGCGEELLRIVQSVLHDERDGIEQMLFHQSQMYAFFSCIARSISTQNSEFQMGKRNYYVQAAVEYIQNHYAQEIKVQDIAEYVGISRSYLATLFQSIMHTSPNAYLMNFRLSRAKEQLSLTRFPVGMIAGMCGYKDALVFSKAFKQHVGMTPSQYRKLDRASQNKGLYHTE
ncbi:AraC family transcriptional regulator [Butyricicoccus sp.]|uniref:AraC family transcriptional regulator n=1 Tax=Butyricicoccus sp. TaxID=2049021 RepID=UPI003D7CBBA3